MANNWEITLDPDAWVPDSTNHPDRGVVQHRPYLAFDAATEETAYSKAFRCPTEHTGEGTLKADIAYAMDSAMSGEVIFGIAVEAISDGDATDLDAGTSFDTANMSSETTVPGTAGYMDVITITLSNDGNNGPLAAGDYVRLKLYRDADAAGDDATGDAHVFYVTIYEEA